MSATEIPIRIVSRGDVALLQAFVLRYRIFALEQEVAPEIELDDEDYTAVHCVAEWEDRVIGTLRILQRPGYTKIGRVAVDSRWREHGVGRRLMDFAHGHILQSLSPHVRLHAQTTVQGFYESLGYTAWGETFLEDGILHIEMRRTLG